MGMEGGVYVMRSGLEKGDGRKVERGMEMLSRNVGRISSLAKNLLSFSKGVVPLVALEDPARPAREVAELFTPLAQQEGIRFETDLQADLAPAPLDREGLHTCLANLVSNALDACKAGAAAALAESTLSGPATYLEKPVTAQTFVRRVAEILGVEDTEGGPEEEEASEVLRHRLEGLLARADRKTLQEVLRALEKSKGS